MSRALRFTKAEISNAAKLCREHNVIVKLTRKGDLLVFPEQRAKVDTQDDDLDAEWAAFEARHGDG